MDEKWRRQQTTPASLVLKAPRLKVACLIPLPHWLFDVHFNHCDYQFLSLLSEHLSH